MKKSLIILIILVFIISVLLYSHFHKKPDIDKFAEQYHLYRSSGLDAEEAAIKACKDANIKNW